MKGISSMTALLLAVGLAWASACLAEDPAPNDGRVFLTIRAADPDGGTLKFGWSQLEGPPVTIADPNAADFDKPSGKWVSKTYFIPKEPGKYVFEVTVTNEGGVAARRTFVQEVLRAVPPPQADAGPDQRKKLNETVVLSGVGSKAFDGRTITQYDWSVKQAPPGFELDETKRKARQIDFKAAIPGKYTFELKVFDGKRWSEPASVEVEIKKPSVIEIIDPPPPGPVELPPKPPLGNETPVRPRADAGEGRANIRVGETVVLDGSKSKADPKDKPQFVWVQKDTPPSPAVRTFSAVLSKPFDPARDDKGNYPVQTFVAGEPGTYKFVLQITTENNTSVESAEVVNVVIPDNTGIVDPPAQNQKPVPFVTYAPKSVEVNEEVRIDASKSISPTGAKLSFQWMQVPLKKFPVIRGSDGPVVRVSADEPGEYWIQPVISDGKEIVKADPISFKVVAGAQPPTIETERTRTCNVRDEIVLKAKITDPAGLPFEIKWSCIEPKLTIPEEYATQPQFRFQPNKPALYLFRIEATNSKGLKASVDVQVGVKDPAVLAPTALLDGPERAVVGDTITISANRSSDPGRNPLSFRWTEETEGGPKIQAALPARNKTEWKFVATEPGRIIVSLTVNNGTTDSIPAKWAIDVAPKKVADTPPVPNPNTGNQSLDNPPQPPPVTPKPIARITGPTSAVAKTEVELSGETSSAADGGALNYSWGQLLENGSPDLGLLPSQMRGKTLKFTPQLPGVYVLTLEVFDARNRRSNTASYNVEVRGAAPVPAPRATVALMTRDGSPVGKEVRLSAQGSADAAGGPLTYKWTQKKGPDTLQPARDNTEEISVTPLKPGTYEFELVVTNAAGVSSAPVSVSFAASAAAPVALPKAVITPVIDPMVGDKVVIDGSNSTALNGAQPQYMWRQLDSGAPPVRMQVGDDRKPKFEIIIPGEGKYVFELKVSDGNDWSEPARLEFNAKPRGKNVPPTVVVDKVSVNTEVGAETVIDASGSSDPDNGPEPLTFRWKRDGALLRFTGPVFKLTLVTAGKITFTVEAFDGKDYSEPATVQVNVMPQGSMPIAIATVSPNPSKKSIKGANAALKNLIVLDGTKSTPEDKITTWTWTQIGGDNLGLRPEQLAKEKVGLYIFKPGTYKFQLIVSDGVNSSKPQTVEVQVEDETSGGGADKAPQQ